MTNSTFDAFARQTANRISRRRSLLTLGAASIAALGGPLAAGAKPSSKKKAKKKANKKCKQQVNQCESSLIANNFPQGIPCCQFLSNCKMTQYLNCLFSA